MRAADGVDLAPWRLAILGLGMMTFAGLVVQHLFWYQVADQVRLTAVATQAHEERQALPPLRGALLDTNGHPLAVTVNYHSVFVFSPQIRDPEPTATHLGQLLNLPPSAVLAKIREADRD